jgi:hypothetical protein
VTFLTYFTLGGFVALSNDTPIDDPKEDLYGLDPFARVIAKSIERMDAPEGVVLAINGPWGAGKSSAVNLIRHHLHPAIAARNAPVQTQAKRFALAASRRTSAASSGLLAASGPSKPPGKNRVSMTFGAFAAGVVANDTPRQSLSMRPPCEDSSVTS